MTSLWNIFWPAPKSHFYIALDIGTSSVRSLLIEKNANGIFGLKKQIHLIPKTAGDEKFIRMVGENLREIIYRYIKGLGRIPERVILGLGSRLAETTLIAIPKERTDNKKPVRADELAEMINTYTSRLQEKTIDSHTFLLTHAEPLRVRLDGYDFDLGRERSMAGKNVELWATLTFVRKDFADELKDLRRAWGGLQIDMRSTQVIAATRIAKSYTGHDFLLVKIGGKSTELTVVKDGLIGLVESLGVGGDDATTELAAALKTTLGHAEDIKRQFGKLNLPEDVSETAEGVLKNHAKALIDKIRELLARHEALLPPTVLIYGGGARAPFIESVMRDKRNFSDFTFVHEVFAKILQAEEMTKDNFKNQMLRGPEDIDLAALALTLITHDG